MTIANLARKSGPFTADGVQTTFAFNFRVLTASELDVYQDRLLVTNFTVNGVGGESGSITFVLAPLEGVVVWIFGDTIKQQPTSYPPQGTFPAVSHETGLDRPIMVVWEQEEALERTPSLHPSTLPVRRNLEFPAPAPPAQLIGWNEAGDELILFPTALLDVTTPAVPSEENGTTDILVDFTGASGTAQIVLAGVILAEQRVKNVTITVTSAIGGATSIQVGGMGQIDGWGNGIPVVQGGINTAANRGDQPIALVNEDVTITAEGFLFNGTGTATVRVHWVTYSAPAVTPPPSVSPTSGELRGITDLAITFTFGVAQVVVPAAIFAASRVTMVTCTVGETIGGPSTIQVGGMGQVDGWGSGISTVQGTTNVVPNRGDQPFALSNEAITITAEDEVFNGTGLLNLRVHWTTYSPL